MDILRNNDVLVEQALEFWGDINSYNESLKEFLDTLSGKLESLENYKNNSDWENYAILSHSIKSEAKYLGFMKDSEIFLDHELKGKEGNGEYINNNFQTLKDTINKIIKILNDYLGDGKKNILVADDSTIILNFIEKSLGNQYNILKATNGSEAMDILDNSNVYAILLDLNMPKVNGFQVLDYLKNHDLIDSIPLIVITGDDTEDTIKKAFSYPIVDILNKPFNDENLKRVLGSINNFYDKKY